MRERPQNWKGGPQGATAGVRVSSGGRPTPLGPHVPPPPPNPGSLTGSQVLKRVPIVLRNRFLKNGGAMLGAHRVAVCVSSF